MTALHGDAPVPSSVPDLATIGAAEAPRTTVTLTVGLLGAERAEEETARDLRVLAHRVIRGRRALRERR